MRRIIRKITRIIDTVNAFNRKYQIAKNSASISFYMLISLISLFVIAIQVVALSAASLEAFLLPKVISVFSEKFSEILMSMLPNFSLNGFSIIILFNIIWSSSRIISLYDRVADYIYLQVKERVGWKSRISAFMMFSMMVMVIIVEIIIGVYANYLISNILKIHQKILLRIVEMIMEILMIFVIVMILYLYAPPIRMKLRNVYKGAFFSSLLIYAVFALFIAAIAILNRLGIAYTILTILSYSLLIVYVINAIIIVGMVINYHNGNIFQLKSALFRKQ